MKSLKTKIPPTVKMRVKQREDGTVDGELLIQKIPRNVSAKNLIMELSQIVGSIPDTFVRVGARLHVPAERRQHYSRYRGMAQAETYWHRASRRRMPYAFLSGQAMVEALLETEPGHRRRGYKKPTQVFVRFKYKPTGKRPRNQKKGRGKKKK